MSKLCSVAALLAAAHSQPQPGEVKNVLFFFSAWLTHTLATGTPHRAPRMLSKTDELPLSPPAVPLRSFCQDDLRPEMGLYGGDAITPKYAPATHPPARPPSALPFLDG